ncbi:hypothetical protein MAMC_01552 [Methylacidimicrobium cyclopophantes]|uniref:DNA recombination and repair protein Rad51-like C-terminal domain-containing protein n=1 Tax=Methylacidimicrobium cyclopophantes TaxID=1041766 RepID=A0A5E6MMQ0_9BACT|nr:hypothetical protein [Methylacidimicrobium cyclopophantes]VVM07321.1 hypothetical protein MAMC_01552 [Methylacidimicrobium cyclopophantes]
MLPPPLIEIGNRFGLLGLPQTPRRKRLSFLPESPDPRLRRGVLSHALTEVVAPGPGSGLLLSAALRFCLPKGMPMALVDGADSFDPKSALAGPSPSLLWVRCRLLREILFAADLLLRDGNFPWVWIDLCRLPLRGLGRIPPTTWHRFQRLSEKRGTATILVTPSALVPAARERYRIDFPLSRDCLEEPRQALWQKLRWIPLRLSGLGDPEAPPAATAG